MNETSMPHFRDIALHSPWRPLSESDARRVRFVAGHLLSHLSHVTDWRLQKTFFLAEVWSIEERLGRLTAADFASWTYGPWSLHVREGVESLEANREVQRESRTARRREAAEFLQIRKEARIPPLPAEDADFLGEIAQQIKFLDGDSLTRVAKSTKPYADTVPRQRIDLDGYLDELRTKHAKFVASPKVARLVEEAMAE